MNIINKIYQVDKAKIGFIRFIFEAHEGIATITTIDPSKGLIRLVIPPERLQTVDMVINALKKDIIFNEVC